MDHATRRNRIKANALNTLAETLLIAATLGAGLAAYQLLANGPHAIAVLMAIVIAFGVDSRLKPAMTGVFGPTIDRLRDLPADKQNPETAR